MKGGKGLLDQMVKRRGFGVLGLGLIAAWLLSSCELVPWFGEEEAAALATSEARVAQLSRLLPPTATEADASYSGVPPWIIGTSTPEATPAPSAKAPASPTAVGTPTAVPPSATSTPRPRATPTARAGWRWFRSDLYPYSMAYPDTWQASSGGLRVGDLVADAFVGPRQTNFAPSVTVHAQPVPSGVDTEAFLQANFQRLTAGGVYPDLQAESILGQTKAFVMSYRVTAANPEYSVQQVLFVQLGMGWVITLSSLPTELGRNLPVFHQMLASFEGR